MDTWMVEWLDFVGKTEGSTGFVPSITAQLTDTALLGILAGLIGTTIGFTLIYRFAGRIKNTIIGAMTNSRRRR